MNPPFILCERVQSVAILRLTRPEKRNALSREMIEELGENFERLKEDEQLRAVILTAAGDVAFCSGTDISELAELSEAEAIEVAAHGQRLCDQIEAFPVPVIAALNGIAAGSGCELTLACHLRIASSDVTFSFHETKLGLIPSDGGSPRLAREAGTSRALEIMLTEKTITAAESLSIGLVNRVVNAADLLTEAKSIANEISQMAPLAIRACLKAVRLGLEFSLEDGLALETELFASLFTTEDVHEGTSAFLEKRSPVFKGR